MLKLRLAEAEDFVHERVLVALEALEVRADAAKVAELDGGEALLRAARILRGGFPALDGGEEIRPAADEQLVRKGPAVRVNLAEAVGVELANKGAAEWGARWRRIEGGDAGWGAGSRSFFCADRARECASILIF